MTVYRDVLAAQQAFVSQKENEAREARSIHAIQTIGVGEIVEPEPLAFPNPFVFEPSVTYAAVLDTVPDRDVWRLPRVTGAVLRWDLNSRGFYVGAYVYMTVDIDPVGEAPANQANPQIMHHFTFSSLSYKELGKKVTDQLQESTIDPRTVDL